MLSKHKNKINFAKCNTEGKGSLKYLVIFCPLIAYVDVLGKCVQAFFFPGSVYGGEGSIQQSWQYYKLL